MPGNGPHPVHRRPLGRLLVEMGALSYEQLEQLLAIQRHDGRRLGEIAVSRGLASPLVLLTALKKQNAVLAADGRRSTDNRPASWLPLGQILVERGLISPMKLQQTLADQREDGGFLGELLLKRGWITTAALVDALSEQIVAADSPGNVFVVRELQSGEWADLHTAATFAEATDFVFDQVLLRRDPGQLAVVHVRGGHEEIAWSYDPPSPEKSKADELLEVLQAFARDQKIAS